ncbi:hypothetical protein KTE49_20760 [Burkholderia multivorans]|uniref:Uncharacterized protein n=1 Tax=Burkholderia multivorans CGD2 TaxID=513052 RepID=B9BQE5_9BURK|nr:MULTISPECIES: hypothetical protein [Burkholderia cepacia complex]EEE06840.1 conserved hypothetical protein [Burkholderia multivorans CGD2]EEE13217.1 conserved hypothetical protein [Burkholderia multivorans CGD2M]MBU9532869.1 hypothetical protein [Burkholderia multivorans]MBY4752057.1 hypothetical protein [Burkholderia dolosa]MCA8249189.1 hypothetical protein [Burkholderia multivorans]
MTKAKKVVCPLLKKPCLEHECAWFAHVVGRDPQTGRDVDHWDCSVRWLPVMMTEGARQTRGVQAAVESMRNDVVQRQDGLNTALNTAFFAIASGIPQGRPVVDITERPSLIEGQGD